MSIAVGDRRNPFSKELAYYEVHKPQWLTSHLGDFVVVCGENLGGFFPNYEEALKAGIQRFGIGSEFLIKQIWEHEPVFAIY
jgi:hypothetical protein